MISTQTSDTFDDWFTRLKDKRAATRIQAHIDRAEDGNLVIAHQLVKVYRKCEFTMAQAIECISYSVASNW